MSTHESPFFQTPPSLQNTFETDPLLKKYLSKKISKSQQKEIFSILQDLGDKAVNELLDLSWTAEHQKPELVQFDPWGNRMDQIQVSGAWVELQNFAAEYGIVATGYERNYGANSRLAQMSLLYLFHPSSAFMSCPLAMTDGAARAIEIYGSDQLKKTAFKNLTSRNPETFWTSGQWMTEKIGGSDVSQSETVAKPLDKKSKTDSSSSVGMNTHELWGTKWFTSSTTSPMAMTLARTNPKDLSSKGLSLFYLETHRADGSLHNIEIHRLKNKLGTHALPTAELSLRGTPAQLVGDEGNGVKKISSLFNVTRIYNSVCAIAHARRALDLAISYSHVRTAFGKRLIDHPLHKKTLMDLEKVWRRCFLMTMKAAELWGADEVGEATADEKNLLRSLTPLVKLWTAKKCMQICSEVVEVFGGAGYVEDTGLPMILRDAQVFSIWEGTTNILSLDLLRAFNKEQGLEAIVIESARLLPLIEKKSPALVHRWMQWFKKIDKWSQHPELLEAHARELAFELAQIYGLSLEIEFYGT